jgi:hypothetical protein
MEYSPGIKRPASETDRSTQTSFEVKNDIRFHGVYMHNVTFVFTLAKLCTCI